MTEDRNASIGEPADKYLEREERAHRIRILERAMDAFNAQLNVVRQKGTVVEVSINEAQRVDIKVTT